MKGLERTAISVLLIAGLGFAGFTILTTETPKQKRNKLIKIAEDYMKDEAYATAVEKLNEAIQIQGVNKDNIHKLLKEAYYNLRYNKAYSGKYTDMLDEEMQAKGATQDVFLEAAEYYLSIDSRKEAIEVLKSGIEKLGTEELIEMYEKNRYGYSLDYDSYEYVSEFHAGLAMFIHDGKEGLVSWKGGLLLSPEYDKIGIGEDRVIVKKDGIISAIDFNGNRMALLKEEATDFGVLSNGYVGMKHSDGYRLYHTNLTPASELVLEDIGTFSNGYLAIKKDGKYGVLDSRLKWVIEPEYEGIVMDDMKRCAGQDCIFVRDNGKVELYREKKATGLCFDDALPFHSEGLAAVKQGNKWGFIDQNGNQVIDFKYEEAKSFGGHLGAVKLEDKWGFVSLRGELVIENIFDEVRTFYKGSVPVKVEGVWKFLFLNEK